ncbi:hypothetical protein [Bradyrhizobium acaciae]|uniref:hypothetical protein n=1 Tax=Bradyrhizobium acaciae TaxID=2683706 RepID=UPI001E3FB577|nr:hypothetical protein [Bradyrhizobium acaciae]MCC8982397.1 hypothetical protein [Bradyrhizobium acaciae]
MRTGREARVLAVGIVAVLAFSVQVARAEDALRFAPLKAEEQSPAQKAWADTISALHAARQSHMATATSRSMG